MLAAVLDTPIGPVVVVADDGRLVRLHMGPGAQAGAADVPRDDAALAGVLEQLAQWFTGERTGFDLTLGAAGSPFAERVRAELLAVPYGATASYGELAHRLGDPGAARAVGLACGRNPVGIVVPCHRVVGADGSLTGFGGGLVAKRWLLEHEQRQTGAVLF